VERFGLVKRRRFSGIEKNKKERKMENTIEKGGLYYGRGEGVY
jgi:hypothetical protein